MTSHPEREQIYSLRTNTRTSMRRTTGAGLADKMLPEAPNIYINFLIPLTQIIFLDVYF